MARRNDIDGSSCSTCIANMIVLGRPAALLDLSLAAHATSQPL